MRVTIAELRRQPRAADARGDLELSKNLIKLGLVEISASLASSVVGVLNPARTPAEIARDLPGALLGPESGAAKRGAGLFMEGLEGIETIVRQPIGPPIW